MAYKFLIQGLGESRNASTLEYAERWARSQCAKNGSTWEIYGDGVGWIATVRRDAYDRVWTDVVETSLL